MDHGEVGADAATSERKQDAGSEIEDQERSPNMKDHTRGTSDTRDSYGKDMGLQDQMFRLNSENDEVSQMVRDHEQARSGFEAAEHLEVHLRFDLVENPMPLDTSGPSESHSDFIRQEEQSGSGVQACWEDNVSLMAQHSKQDQRSYCKMDKVEGREATTGRLGELVGQEVSGHLMSLTASQQLQEDEAVLGDIAVASDTKGDQKALASICDTNLEAERQQPVGSVYGNVRENVVDAESLKLLASSAATKLGVLGNSCILNSSEAPRGETRMAMQHLGSLVVCCKKSIELADEIKSNNGESIGQRQITLLPSPKHNELVAPVPIGEHLISDAPDAQKDSTPLNGGISDSGPEETDLHSHSDCKVVHKIDPTDTQKAVDADILPSEEVALGGIEHMLSSSEGKYSSRISQKEKVKRDSTEQKDTIITSTAGDSDISGIPEHKAATLGIESPGGPANDLKKCISGQGIEDIFAEGGKESCSGINEYNGNEQGAEAEGLHSCLSIKERTSEGSNDHCDARASDTNTGTDRISMVDRDMQDVPESESEKRISEKWHKNADKPVLGDTAAVEASAAEAGQVAVQLAESKELEKVSKAPSEDDNLRLQNLVQLEHTMKKACPWETSEEEKQAFSLAVSRPSHVGDCSTLEPTCSGPKPEVSLSASKQEGLSSTDIQSVHGDRQVSELFIVSPHHLKNQDDHLAQSLAVVKGVLASINPAPGVTQGEAKERGETGAESKIVSVDPKTSLTARRADKGTDDQVYTELEASSVSASGAFATCMMELDASQPKEDPNSRVVSEKVTADQAGIGKQKDVYKINSGHAMHNIELLLPQNENFPSLKTLHNLGEEGNAGISPSQMMSGQENAEQSKSIHIEDAVTHQSDSALLANKNKKSAKPIQNRVSGSIRRKKDGGASAKNTLSLSPKNKKVVSTSVVQDGKALLQASDVLSRMKNAEISVSVGQDGSVLVKPSAKVDRRLKVKDSLALAGNSPGQNSPLRHNGTSSQDQASEGIGTLTLLRKAHQTAHENAPSPNLNQRTLPVSSRQQTPLPDLNVAELVPVVLGSQPFNDSQQIQLRAQILVYGSLIQGVLPEETLMKASFSDVIGGRWESGRDSGRNVWEKVWRTATEKVQSRTLPSTPRDPPHPCEVISNFPTTTSEGSIRAKGISSSTENPRNPPVLNTRFLDASALNGQLTQSIHLRRSIATGTGTQGSRRNQEVPTNSIRVPDTSAVMHAPPSLLGETLKTPQSGRSLHVDSQQIPARTIFSTSHLGPFLPGPTQWMPPSSFLRPWLPLPQTRCDSMLSFTHAQSIRSSDMTQESAGSGKATSSNGLSVSTISINPSFSTPVPRSSPILTRAASHAGSVQRKNATSTRVVASDPGSQKRKKTQTDPSRIRGQSEPYRMPMDNMVTASTSLVSPGSVPITSRLTTSPFITLPTAGSLTTFPLSVPMWGSETHQNLSVPSNLASLQCCSSPETLAMAVASTQVLASSFVDTPVLAPSASQASIPFVTNALGIHSLGNHQPVPIGKHQDWHMLTQNAMSHLEQEKVRAEEASSIAAFAVRESESMWSRLQTQNSSGLISDTEVQLASSAIAMATAASVAKAAAATAKVAYEAILQTKMIREAASDKAANGWLFPEDISSEKSAIGTELSKETNKSLSQTWKIPRSFKSVMETAKQTSKKKFEVASAARMRAQNLDSIVRAAELAAVTVSQAGNIVAMGDSIPFTLDMLLDGGPEGLHRLGKTVSPGPLQEKEGANQKGMRHKPMVKDLDKGDESAPSKKNLFRNGGGVLKEHCMEEETQTGSQLREPYSKGAVDQPINNGSRGLREIAPNSPPSRRETRVDDFEGAGTQSGFHQEEALLSAETEQDMRMEQGISTSASQIVKDSIVEVLSDEEGLRGVWFSAKVLNLEGGKALLLYDELLSDDGSNPLEEWIDLEGAPGEAPRVRMAHPISNISLEGTRKRRRVAMGNHKLSVRDRVDAWIRDGWWEGEVVDVADEVEGKVKVFFPGEGDTAQIRTSNLRPSLVWSNGQWILWTDIKHKNNKAVHEGETPIAKRQKIGNKRVSSSYLIKEKNTEPSTTEKVPVLSHTKENQSDKVVIRDNEADRDIQAKEISKVVFGVPKPSKKRRFIEVSKHYSSKVTSGSPIGKDIDKHEDHKASASVLHRESAGPSKGDGVETNRKLLSSEQTSIQKEPDVFETVQTKNKILKSEKKSSSGLHKIALTEDSLALSHKTMEGKPLKNAPSVGNREDSRPSGNISGTLPKENSLHKPYASFKDDSISLDSDVMGKDHSSKETDKDRDKGQPGTEILEPRRSNRKIQPTSKLLEGLQSTPKFVKRIV